MGTAAVAPSTVLRPTGLPAPPSAQAATPGPQTGPSPAQQLVAVLSPLRVSAPGSQQLTLGLRPDGLGTVKATVTVADGRVVVQLSTDTDDAQRALRDALPLLRQQLSGDGTPATVLLSDDRSGASHDEPPSQRPDGADEEPDATAAPGALRVGTGQSLIDLHL